MPRFSIVTTCKGRLHHLKDSLPRFLKQRDTEVIVVDYDCPDGTGDYVRRVHPEAKVVSVADAPVFNISHARNLGAAAATGEWLAFLDADVMVAPNMFQRIAAMLSAPGNKAQQRKYFRFQSGMLSLFGSCLVRQEDFRAVQGYDAVIQGYGGEDNDLYARLERNKVARGRLDAKLVEACLDHGQEERVQFFKRKSVPDSIRINTAYRVVKLALLEQYGVPELPEAMRQSLYVLVRRSVKSALRSGLTSFRLALPLPALHGHMPFSEWEAKRELVLQLTLKQTATEAEIKSGRGLQKFLRQ
ncbi:glycosyltransferase family 2 protein [Dongia sp.]|uniref:glycosyltransferase family 2 protein n=1 Tax=Dongia sp. TaxID=1977262 RepID=UPI003752E43F